MSFEEIILEVQGKLEMWLSRHPLYKSRATAKKTWNEIAVKLGLEEEMLKKRWKHLKDQYRKELKKQRISTSGAEAPAYFTSSWQYFQLMSFMKDELIPAETVGNLDSSENDMQDTL